MTLNDLKWRNSPYFAFFSLISISLLAKYVAVVEYRPAVRKYCLSVPVFHFWPVLTHPAGRSLRQLSYLFSSLSSSSSSSSSSPSASSLAAAAIATRMYAFLVSFTVLYRLLLARFPALRTQRKVLRNQRKIQNAPPKRNRTCSNLTQAIPCDKFQPCHWPLLAYVALFA